MSLAFFTHSHQVLAPSNMNSDSDMHVSKTAHKSPGKNHDVWFKDEPVSDKLDEAWFTSRVKSRVNYN